MQKTDTAEHKVFSLMILKQHTIQKKSIPEITCPPHPHSLVSPTVVIHFIDPMCSSTVKKELLISFVYLTISSN